MRYVRECYGEESGNPLIYIILSLGYTRRDRSGSQRVAAFECIRSDLRQTVRDHKLLRISRLFCQYTICNYKLLIVHPVPLFGLICRKQSLFSLKYIYEMLLLNHIQLCINLEKSRFRSSVFTLILLQIMPGSAGHLRLYFGILSGANDFS